MFYKKLIRDRIFIKVGPRTKENEMFHRRLIHDRIFIKVAP